VTPPGEAIPSARPGWRAIWRARPARVSASLWAVVILLDRLPWPWGEGILARIYLLKAIFRGTRLRRALRWAGAQTESPIARWRLAVKLCSYYGRFVARLLLVGFRGPDHFGSQVVVNGEEHLAAARGHGVILLGFHLGPPGAALALRATGHELTWARGWGDSQSGSGEGWRRFHQEGEMLSLSQSSTSLGGVLYEARRVLLDGGVIYITADGGRGRRAFKISAPGAPMIIRSGWLALCRHTKATVLPVLTHLDGNRQVVTIHPPLPPIDGDPARAVERCRAALGQVIAPYLREHPEQCYSLVFGRREKKKRSKDKRRPPSARPRPGTPAERALEPPPDRSP